MPNNRLFAGLDYLKALKKHYPLLLKNHPNLFGFVGNWLANEKEVGNDQEPAERFVRPENHTFNSLFNAWSFSIRGSIRWLGASCTYKGLINLKPPFDLVLYSNLIWELQPKTIIEFGSLQGGSSLWFADQQQTLCGGGTVHSFDILNECIHPRAKHPNLHFHEVDLEDLSSLDKKALKSLPHPWLVVDDAHCNLKKLVPYMSSMMKPGDYYIIEDVYVDAPLKVTSDAVALMNKCKLIVDKKYTDAFGTNVTCSPNAWLVKR